MSRISVIVPVYNVEKYIERCINSIKLQSMEDFECLVINDGTKDASMEIAERAIGNDARFVIINKENGGYGSVQEVGIASAKSPLVTICDSDDWLEENCLRTACEKIDANGADIFISGRYRAYSDGVIEYDSMFPEPDKKYTVFSRGERNFPVAGEIIPGPHGKVFRTDLVKGLHFAHHVSYTDCELYLLAYAKASKIIYNPEPLAYYLIDRQGNSMSANMEKFILQHITVFNHMLDQAEQLPDTDPSFYFRVFENLKVLFYELGNSSLDRKIKLSLGDQFYELFRRLISHREEISPLIGSYSREGLIARLKNYRLLNPKSSRSTYDKWLQKLMRNAK